MAYMTTPQMWDVVLPIRGITDTQVDITGTLREVAAGETGDYTTDFSVSNQHLYLYINSITGSGDVTITGTSLSESTTVPVASDTEVITVDTALVYYQSDKKWWEVTNIDIPAGISAIDYDIGVVGYADMHNTAFRILGYRVDMYMQGINPDARLQVLKIKDDGNKQMSLVYVEDIGFDADAAGNQIIDHLRSGADDRSYNPTVGAIVGDNEMLTFKQYDLDTYFTAGENVFLCDQGHEGIIVRILGEGGGISNVDWGSLMMMFKPYRR
jgi:3D (Asp-Asp-Asp) domain-containing protein